MLGFRCEGCDSTLTASDEMAGFPIRCPKCEKVAIVPNGALATASPVVGAVGPTLVDGLVPCPCCRERIPPRAMKCRFCNELLASAGGGSPLRWEGDLLVVPEDGAVPGTCCGICAIPGPIARFEKEFVFVPPLAYVAFAIGILPGAILAFILQRKSTVSLPLCESCAGRWSRSTVIFPLACFLGLVGLPFGLGFVGNAIAPRDGTAFGAVIGFLAWFVAIFVVQALYAHRRQAVCTRIDELGTVLRLPRPADVRAAWSKAEA